mgnify:FL=1
MIDVDCLIIGAGFSGATIAERIAAGQDRKVLLLEKRNHIGGNAHDRPDETGITIHPYGPHLFHTNSSRVWNYLSGFTDWRPYEHKVLARIDGKLVPVPFNLNSLHALFPAAQADHLEQLLVDQYGHGARVPILKLRESSNDDIGELADFIYRKIFLGYTSKQWGMKPEELSPSVTARVPVLVSRDNRYFRDTWQAIPEQGYTRLFERMLDHPNITVRLGEDFFNMRDRIRARQIFYTGPIDAWFNYRFGRLPYRSLEFVHENLPEQRHQPVGTINYPNEHAYTRVTEFRHITGQPHSRTAIVREYPCTSGDPYYPVPIVKNEQLYKSYEVLAREERNVTFIGRLASYRYYNMDQVVAAALARIDKPEKSGAYK